MAKPNKITINRMSRFLELISRSLPGQMVSKEEIISALESIDTSPVKRWDKVIGHLVDVIEQERVAGKDLPILQYEKGNVLLVNVNRSQFDERLTKNADQKSLIARCLLHWLFDMAAIDFTDSIKLNDSNEENLQPNFPASNIQFENNWENNEKIRSILLQKRTILRSRTIVSTLVDAGSSNFELARQMANPATQFPLNVRLPSGGHRKVSLGITTNSIPIANLVSEQSGTHAFTLRMIGGLENPFRRSIVGEEALESARSMHGRGLLDLSVIGTTGLRTADDGDLSAYMDDAMECNLKSELLSLSNFKVLICDSSKITMGACSHIFSSVTSDCLDLVVTDDGELQTQNPDSPFYKGLKAPGEQKKEVQTKLAEFGRKAAMSGVGVIFAKRVEQNDEAE